MSEFIRNRTIEGSRGRPILYDLFLAKDPENSPLVIFCHGFKGYKDWGPFDIAFQNVANEGFNVLKFNFSFNGGTVDDPIDFPDLEAFGKNTYSTELDDLGCVLDAIDNDELESPHDLKDHKKFLIGHSRGGGIAILKTSEDTRIDRVVTWSAVSDFFSRIPTDDIDKWRKEGVIYIPNARTGQDMPMYYQFYEDLMDNQERLNILQGAQLIEKPWAIIHGEEDETVGVQEALKLKELAPNAELHIIPGTGHTFDGKQPWPSDQLPDAMEKALSITLELFRREVQK